MATASRPARHPREVSVSDKPGDWQEQMREMLRAQQDAYVGAVKAWRDAVAAAMAAGTSPPQAPPQPPPFAMPTPGEMTEASYAFASRLLADQSRFLEALSKAMSGSDKPS
jgi:hypothetical protein